MVSAWTPRRVPPQDLFKIYFTLALYLKKNPKKKSTCDIGGIFGIGIDCLLIIKELNKILFMQCPQILSKKAHYLLT